MPGDYLESSRAKAAAGDAAGAFADALHAVQRAPDTWVSHAQVALTAEAVGASKVGLQAAEQWARLAPGNWQAHATVGRFNLALDRGAPARLAFYQAWQLNPNDPDVHLTLTLLDAELHPGHDRRLALARVEKLVADGRLGPEVLSSLAEASVTRSLFLLSGGASWLALIYLVIVGIYQEQGLIGADTVLIPVLASAAAATVLVWWFGALWRRLSPATRRRLPGIFRREPSEAVTLLGQTAVLVLLLMVPFVWSTGAGSATFIVTGVAWTLSLLTEMVATGLGLHRMTGLRDLLPLLFQPPYIIVGAIIMFSAVLIGKELGPGLRRLFHR